jgi:glycyl-tRNA synthetase (class II)
MEIRNLPDMETLVALCKRRGFVFPGSEIYGGLANSWDYGPLGVELRNNIKNLWWDRFVRRRADIVGLEAAIIMNPKVWEKSGHTETFNDPLVECETCHNRFRTDTLLNLEEFEIWKSALLEFATLNANQSAEKLKHVSTLLEAFDLIFPDDAVLKTLPEEEKAKLLNSLTTLNVEIRKKLNEIDSIHRENSQISTTLAQANEFSGALTQIYLRRKVACPICSENTWDRKPHRACSSILKTCSIRHAYVCRLVLRRLVKRSAMKLLRVTLSSVHASLNRWK